VVSSFLSPRAVESRDLNPKETTMNRSLAVLFASLLAMGASSLALADGAAPAPTPQAAATAGTPAQDTKDIRQDKKSIHRTSSQRRQATRQMDRDKAAGNTAGAKAERQAVKGDTKTIRQDKRAIHGARKDRRQTQAQSASTGGGK